MRLIFMGTPLFAVPSLEHLVAAGFPPVAVVTGPDRGRGRGQKVTPTPVKQAAVRLGIDAILQPASVRDPAFAEEIRALAPDVMAVVAFKILPPAVYTAASEGAFNLHGSLLPAYRGAAPIQRAVMAGEEETGVTTFFLKEQVDTGGIILQRRMPVGRNETAGEVHDRMKMLGAEAVVETVRRIEAGTAEGQPQDDRKATPAPKIFKEDARIPWERTAEDVHNHIRGLSPYPGAWTMHGDTLLKIYRSRVPESAAVEDAITEAAAADADEADAAADDVAVPDEQPGVVLAADDALQVACGAGRVELLDVQQQGRRRLPARDFLNGYGLHVGERFA